MLLVGKQYFFCYYKHVPKLAWDILILKSYPLLIGARVESIESVPGFVCWCLLICLLNLADLEAEYLQGQSGTHPGGHLTNSLT